MRNLKEWGIIGCASVLADVIAVAENPLNSISALEHPLGVMSAGRCKTREQLDALLEALRAKYDTVLK